MLQAHQAGWVFGLACKELEKPHMIFKSLQQRRVRTALTVFGIAVGVAAVVSLGALADGFVAGYATLASGSDADVLVMQDDALDIIFSAVDQQVGPILAGFSDVQDISEMVYTFAATDGAPYFIVYGYDPDGFAIRHFKIVEGESLSREVGRRSGKPLLLGKTAAEDLDKHVGDTLRLYESVHRVVGIYETGQPFEDGAAVVLLEDAQAINGKPRQVNAYLLKVREGTDVARLQARIQQRFARSGDPLTATTSAEFEDEQDTLQYVNVFTWAVSLVATLIGGVGVMNTVLMSVFERTREFGVLRAVGWKSGQVLSLVLGESLGLSLLGGLVGTALGMALVRAVQNVPTANAVVVGTLTPERLAQGIGVALGLGLMGGALPAWRASGMLPVEAMRSEGGSVHATRHVRWGALRNVLRQPVRTLLTVIGIGIAMMAIILLGAMGDGMVDMMSGLAGGLEAHLVGSETDASVDLSKIDEGVVRRIAALPGVESSEGFLTGYTTLGDLPFFVVFGYQPRGVLVRGLRIVEGEPLTTNRQILLGRVAAENLDKQVGQTLSLFDGRFKIVGIYETGVPFQDGGGVIALRDAQSLFGQPRKVSFMGIRLTDPRKADAVIADVESRFPEVSLSKASEFAEDLGDIQMMRASTWGIALMALIIGGLGMANTMVMSVMERTREIGVLRALGWRKRRVLWMIVRESIALSLLGSAAGVAVGLVLGLMLNQVPTIEGFLRLRYSVGLFAQAIGTALILGIVGGIYPAWRASRLQPVEALRYE
jgi:ABC-type antimicrobial peptide transport system permease subunit